MGFGFSTIFGVSLGFEFMPKEIVNVIDKEASWGISIDLFIFRFILTF